MAYVAGPYRGSCIYKTVQNIRAAEAVAVELWGLGYAALCPHKNTALFDGALGPSDEMWLAGALELMKRCDFVVMVPGWESSAGSLVERDTAQELGMKIYEWPRHRPHLTPIEEKVR